VLPLLLLTLVYWLVWLLLLLLLPLPQAMRLTLVQVLMNSKGYNMNPLQSLYYVSPACLVSLLVPFCELSDEADAIVSTATAAVAQTTDVC
jgi:hypothetical protein